MNCYHYKPLIPPEVFQEMICERKAERKRKAEEKRQDGLRQIQEQIKLKSVAKEKESLDAEGESNHVRDILFPQALKFVLDRVKNLDYVCFFLFDKNDIAASELSPFVKLREVSKSLKKAMDRWFEEKIDEQIHKPFYRPSRWNELPPMMFYLCSAVDRIQGLIENYGFAAGPSFPPVRSDKAFFVRTIEVVLLTPVEYPFNKRQFVLNDLYLPFIADLRKLLELIGDQILSFKLKVNPVDYFSKHGVTFTRHYLMLRECCELMPNLKRLDVYFLSDESVKVTRAPKDLAEAIETNPFPTLVKLERISLEQEEEVHVTPKIYDAILKANPHVKMLKFMMEDKILKKVPLDTLKALNLEYFSWDNSAFKGSPRSYDLLICKNWPLKTLDIQMGSHKLCRIFQTLNEFPTLEMLALSLANVEIGREKVFLMLPNLTYFKCEFEGKTDYKRDDVNFFFGLQFLVHAKKLRRLRWTYLNVDEALLKYLEGHECPEKMIDFRAGRKDLKSTNVYDVFPDLERVEVEGDTIVTVHRRPAGKIKYCEKCHMTADYDWIN